MSVSAATAGAGPSTGAALLGRLPPVSVPHVSLIQADCTTHPLLATFNANTPQKPGEQQKSSRCRDNFQAFFCRCLKVFHLCCYYKSKRSAVNTSVLCVYVKISDRGLPRPVCGLRLAPDSSPFSSLRTRKRTVETLSCRIVPVCSSCNGLQAVFGLAVIPPGNHGEV